MLKQEITDADKEEMLDLSFLNEDQEQANIIFDVLSFIHTETFYPSSEVDKAQLLWMRTAVNTIVEIINEYLDHPFTKDSKKACEEFLKQSFNNIRSLTSMKLVNFLRVIVGLGRNFSLGIILVTLILEEVQRTGELLLNEFYQGRQGTTTTTSPSTTNHTFRVYLALLHSLLPDFGLVASSAIGVGNPEKDKLAVPKVSLGEIRKFSLFLDNWASVVDMVLLGFSQVNKEAAGDLRQVKKLICDLKQKIFVKKIR